MSGEAAGWWQFLPDLGIRRMPPTDITYQTINREPFVFVRTSFDPTLEGLPAGGGLPNHRKPIKDLPGVLDVVAVVSNPCRYKSRYDLYRAFERHIHASGARLTTVELAFGERPWELTEPDNPRHVQVRTGFELWHKENLINLGVQRLPRDWKYVAWIDADVSFARPDWVQEALHQLQHHAIVQLFSHVFDLGPTHAPLSGFYGPGIRPASWGYCHRNGLPKANTDLKKTLLDDKMNGAATDGYGKLGAHHYWHPGFAWACRRETWEALGGLIDVSILGAGDYLMASALTGDLTLSDWLAPSYKTAILEWKARADRHVRGDLGYVDGLVLHHWHGPKAKRGYRDRWRIFHDHGFDPELDLKRDWQGLWQLTERSTGLRDDIRRYFRQRDEDSSH